MANERNAGIVSTEEGRLSSARAPLRLANWKPLQGKPVFVLVAQSIPPCWGRNVLAAPTRNYVDGRKDSACAVLPPGGIARSSLKAILQKSDC